MQTQTKTKHFTQIYYEQITLIAPMHLPNLPKMLFTVANYQKQIVFNHDCPWSINDFNSYKNYCLKNGYEYENRY